MSDTIKLVQGDTRPRLQVTLTDTQTGNPIDLSDALTAVSIEFRQRGGTAVTPIPCTKVGDGSTGEVLMDWPAGALDGDPGSYEGQIVIQFGAQRQTVYELLRFSMRDNFA